MYHTYILVQLSTTVTPFIGVIGFHSYTCINTTPRPGLFPLRLMSRRINLIRPHSSLWLEPLPDIEIRLGWPPRVRMRPEPGMLLV